MENLSTCPGVVEDYTLINDKQYAFRELISPGALILMLSICETNLYIPTVNVDHCTVHFRSTQ